MEKRLILAVLLTLIVFFSWSFVVSKFYLVENKEVNEKILQIPSLPSESKPSAPTTSIKNTPASVIPASVFEDTPIEVKAGKRTFIFNESDATLKSVNFSDYQAYKFDLGRGFFLKNINLSFVRDKIDSNSISFIAQDKNIKIFKRFIFSNINYSMELEILIENLTSTETTVDLDLLATRLDFKHNIENARFQDILVALETKDVRTNGKKELEFNEMRYIGWRDRYFCAVVQPEITNKNFVIKRTADNGSELIFDLSTVSLYPNQVYKEKFSAYLGPQVLDSIRIINSDWGAIIHYGTFDIISQVLSQLLNLLYSFSHNWGVSIILFSFAIYLILYPLTLKQMRSMKEMQLLQPKIEELRSTYKDNPQKLNKEIMELYKIHKVNPFGGCLPLILQLPIFFALYQVLMRSVHLKGASFLWIKDLSEPDKLFILQSKLPVLGNEINILPILMVGIMFFQQKISSMNMSSSSAEQQKIMAIMMPLMFGFFFYHMPSGLVLYWLMNSGLTFLYQLKVNKLK